MPYRTIQLPLLGGHEMMAFMKTVITYGTFDLLHAGHINLLKRAREHGDRLIVGLSTEDFNHLKHKEAFLSYSQRKSVLEAIRYVDIVIPERSWEQKEKDIKEHKVDILVMGSDWKGKFDYLRKYCTVAYVPRTRSVSSTALRSRVYGNV
jgi:glycerol-3-phosphate cytidylyltransferase